MRILLSLLFLFGALSANADIYCVRVDSSATNIPTTFSTASTSLVIQGIRNVRSVIVDNRSAVEVALNCSVATSSAPATSSVNVFYVNAATAWVIDNTNLSGACFLRSNGSAITTGIVEVCLVGG